jgi:hypothetical protein
MPPVESPTTLATAETAVSALTWKELETRITGKPAPRPDKKNLWIEIDIDLNNEIALFNCTDEEHVLDHKPRSVTFRADQDCLLVFSNQAVFGCEVVQLFAHKEKVLFVNNNVGKNVETLYAIDIMRASEGVAKATKMKKTEKIVVKRPPVIVVP